MRHGVTRRAAEALCATHPATVIAANVRLLEATLAGGASGANPGAWPRRAIEQGWARIDAPTCADRRDADGIADRDETVARYAFERFRRRRSREAFAVRSKTFRTRRRNAFVAAMEAEGNRTVLDALARGGWENPMVDACLFGHGTLMNDLLTAPHERDLERFVAWRRRAELEIA